MTAAGYAADLANLWKGVVTTMIDAGQTHGDGTSSLDRFRGRAAFRALFAVPISVTCAE